MVTRRTPATEALVEVFEMVDRISSTTNRRARRDLDDLAEAVEILINVFPEARQQHMNNVRLDEHEPEPYYMNPAPTMSEAPQSPPSASRTGTRRTTTMSSDPHYRNKVERVTSQDYARMIAGNWVRDPVAHAQAMQEKGTWYQDITARGHSFMIAGDVYGGDNPFGDVLAQPAAAAPPA